MCLAGVAGAPSRRTNDVSNGTMGDRNMFRDFHELEREVRRMGQGLTDLQNDVAALTTQVVTSATVIQASATAALTAVMHDTRGFLG